MYKVFKELGASSAGKVLSREEFLQNSILAKPEFDDEKMKYIIEEAEGYLEADIPFLPLCGYREFKITGNRSNFQQPYSKRRDMLFALSLAEYHEGKGRFASKLADVIWAILEESTWVVPAHAVHNPTNPSADAPPVYNESDLHGIDLYAGSTGALLAMTLHFNREVLESFSPFLTERIEYEVKKRIIKPYISNVFGWSGEYGSRCNNWCAWINDNILYVTAMLEERASVREFVVARAMKQLDNFSSSLPADGGCDEGPGYWGAAAAAYFSSLETIYEMTGGAVDVFSHSHVKNMGEYIAKVNINDDNFVNFADCSPKMYPNGFLIMRYGERVGSEFLFAFGKMMAAKCSPRPQFRRPSGAIRDLTMPIPKDALITKADRFTWMPALKVLVARESEDTSKGMFLAIKGGHNKESHNHNDVGSYVIYHSGEPVIIDAGSVSYTRDTFGKNRYTIWCMQSHYHNLPAFDGVGEHNGIEFCSTREVYDEDSHLLTLGLEKAYRSDAGVIEYTRQALLDGGVATVSDDIHLDSEREIDFRLMTHRMPEKLGDGKLMLNAGIVLEYDPVLEFSVEEFDPPMANPEQRWGTPVLYRMHFVTKAKDYKCQFKYYKA
ncbi:MAG: heparinase II/III family protein [Clostridia bacterium]|nr:heparinase II/III family protein [Clostridia bacterium]